MNNIVQFFAHCISIATRVDKSLKITFETQEVTDAQAAEIVTLRNKLGYIVFAEQTLRPEDIDVPDVELEFRAEKSPSQRLRNVLYRVWEQSDVRGIKDFNNFYRDEMEKIIDHYKKKLI